MAWDLPGIEKLLHWLSPRFMTFLLLVCGALFFAPSRWTSQLSLDGWIAIHRTLLGGGFFVSAVYLIPFGISPMVENWASSKVADRKMSHVMSSLAVDEKKLIRRFYFPDKNGRLIVWPHEVGKLASDGVVFCPGEAGLRNEMVVYSLTPAALRYIEKHKTFVSELDSI
jgi:hypothetical protein